MTLRLVVTALLIAAPVAASAADAPARVRRAPASAASDSVLVARADWSALADRHAAALGEDPSALALGRAAVFAALAGRAIEVDALTEALRDRAARSPAEAPVAAATLLLADRGDAAFDVMLDAGLERDAFNTLVGEMRYDEALALAASSGDADLAIARAHLLGALGDRDAASEILDPIAAGGAERPEIGTRALREMATLGLDGQAQDRAAAWLTEKGPDRSAAIVTSLFPTRASAALAVHSWLRRTEPGIDPALALARTAMAVDARAESPDARRILDEAPHALAGLTPCEQARVAEGFSQLAELRGRQDVALVITRQWAEGAGNGHAWLRLGDRLFAASQWALAADAFGRAAALLPQEPGPAFLQAAAAQRAGDARVAATARALADARASASTSAANRLACAMDRTGDSTDARARREEILASGEHGPEVLMAATMLANRERCAGEHAPASHALDRARAIAALGDDLVPQRVAEVARLSQAARLDAAAGGGDLDAALALSARVLQPFLDDLDASADLLAALRAADRASEADVLASRLFDRIEIAADAMPDSARLANSLAWFSARSGFGLEAGERAARRAVELAPQSAGIADTLAEVLFQRGDVAEAVEVGARAASLATTKEYHQRQLARFRTGSPATRPPLED